MGSDATLIARVSYESKGLKRDLSESGRDFRIEPIRITPRMLLRLTSTDSTTAKIEPLMPEEQKIPLPGHGFAHWMWAVHPLKPGEIELSMVAFQSFGKDDAPEFVHVKHTKITINPNPAAETIRQRTQTFFDKMGEELSKILAAAIGTGIGAAGIWMWARFRKRRKDLPDWEQV